jgi:type 1 fimbria pilin
MKRLLIKAITVAIALGLCSGVASAAGTASSNVSISGSLTNGCVVTNSTINVSLPSTTVLALNQL